MQHKVHAPNGTPCLQSNPGGLGEGGGGGGVPQPAPPPTAPPGPPRKRGGVGGGGGVGGRRLLGKHAVHVQVARWRLADSRAVGA